MILHFLFRSGTSPQPTLAATLPPKVFKFLFITFSIFPIPPPQTYVRPPKNILPHHDLFSSCGPEVEGFQQSTYTW